MAFPCFDQPDLKARFTLEITAPEEWTVISNTAAQAVSPAGAGRKRTLFAETLPRAQRLYLTQVHASIDGGKFPHSSRHDLIIR